MYSCFYESKKSLGCLMQREEKQQKIVKMYLLKHLLKKIFLTSKVVYDRPSIKWTSRKGNDTLYYYVILLKVD